MVFYTGFNFTFISLDRPAIGAGRSYVGVFGDEVKYFPEEKFTNLLEGGAWLSGEVWGQCLVSQSYPYDRYAEPEPFGRI